MEIKPKPRGGVMCFGSINRGQAFRFYQDRMGDIWVKSNMPNGISVALKDGSAQSVMIDTFVYPVNGAFVEE
jgi:hypothetical protein